MSLLEIDGINSYYGDSHVLFDVSMEVREGEVVALLGRNGAGKSTTLLTAAGVIHPHSGAIRFAGKTITRSPTHEIALLGLQLVPEERRVFGGLTVDENLRLAAFSASSPWPVDRIYEVFPRLAERRRSHGRHLSGGEQQMLTIARALIRNPPLILLDEPFEGLAPAIVQDLLRICDELARQGQTMVIVEQNVHAALKLCQRVYILNNGHMVYHGSSQLLLDDHDTMSRYLGL